MTDATPNIDNGDFSAHDPWDANSNYWAKEAGRLNGENIVLRQRIADLDDAYAVQRDAKEQLVERIAELEAENHTFRMAQKACETCDAPTMQRIAELEALARLVVDDPVQINLQRLEQALGGD